MDEKNTTKEVRRIRQVREAVGMKQKEFAAKLGITQSYLSAVELGKKEITTKLSKALIELFGVSPDWIMSGIGSIFKTENVPLIFNQLSHQSGKNSAFAPKTGQNKQLNIRSSSENDAALLASNFDVESLESVRGTGGPSSLNPWATGYIIELQQNQHWLNIDRQLDRALRRLLRVQELLEDLVGIRFDDASYEALKKKVIQRPSFDAAGVPSDPIAEMSDAQKRAYYASRERLLEQCETQFTEHLNTLHQSITHPQNLHLTPRKGSAGEALRPFLEQRHQERFGNEENE